MSDDNPYGSAIILSYGLIINLVVWSCFVAWALYRLFHAAWFIAWLKTL